MHWYSTLKSILFQHRPNSRHQPVRRHETLKLPPLPQPALVGGTLVSGTLASNTLDRRAIRLRRD